MEWKALHCVVAFYPDFLFPNREHKYLSNNSDLSTLLLTMLFNRLDGRFFFFLNVYRTLSSKPQILFLP